MPKNNGADKFIKDLEKLEKKMLTKTIMDAAKAALKPLLQDIKRDAPVDTGVLKRNIKIKSGPRRKGFIIAQVEIKTPDDNPHAARVELGTKETPAEPFVRPNVKALKDRIIENFRDNIDRTL